MVRREGSPREERGDGIRRSLVIIGTVSLLSIAAVLFLVSLSHREFVSVVKGRFTEQQFETGRQTARGIEENLKFLVRELEILSQDPAVRRIDPERAPAAMERVFEVVRAYSVNDVARSDAAGISRIPLKSPQLTGRDFSFREYFQKAKVLTEARPVFEFITFEGVRKGGRGIVMAMPVFSDGGAFDGTVLFLLEAENLIRDAVPEAAGGMTTMVIEDNGTVLYHPRIATGTLVGDLTCLDGTFKSFLESLEDGAGVTGEYRSMEGAGVIATSHPITIGDRKWFIVIERDEAALEDLMASHNRRSIAGFLLAVAVILAAAFVASGAVRRWSRAVSREVQERRRTEEYLRAREETYRTLVENSPG